MRKWGIVITVCYALILLGLLLPGLVLLAVMHPSAIGAFRKGLLDSYQSGVVWLPLGIFISSQALLLFLSVDTSFKRLKPRAHIAVSCIVAALLMGILTAAGVWSLGFGIVGDKFGDTYLPNKGIAVVTCAVLWLFWGILFYFYFRDSSAVVTRLVSWLLKGSVLELLIAVPCHIIVRRRQDCSAPAVTGFGIATGLAIMLLSFGPSVLFLYKKRLDAYPPRPSA
ncbi:MAG TPA: hypothetical protein VJW94_10285 [Candidatus Acidoferrum sp.]|nr:hypothetical protein [Candidatus Acidoferrum sp.]